MTNLIDGRAIAEQIHAETSQRIATLKGRGVRAGLAFVRVGEDPASRVYVGMKEKTSERLGIQSTTTVLPATTSQAELLALIAKLNVDASVHGILVQAPLPAHIDQATIFAAVSPAKDVDGLHPVNVGRLALGQEGFVSCTPQGCLMLLKDVLGDLSGADALVIGRSGLVGRPMANLLIRENCTVTVAHSKSRDLPSVTRRADIVVAAVGRPEMVRGDWLKPGATVIDVGMNRIALPDGKTRLIGDVAYAEAVEVAGAITPVPGGVGPMTIACLLRNTLIAATPK